MLKLHELTAEETAQKIKNKEITTEESVKAIFERIHNFESKINAYVTIVEKEALKKAMDFLYKIKVLLK